MNKPGNKFANDKIAQQITKSLSVILQRKTKDPRIGMVSINEVKVTRDLSLAKVYVTKISNDSDKKVAGLLNKMAGFLRTELAASMTTRSVPELRFYDDTIQETSQQLEDIFSQIHKDQDNH